jgi:hypothetical protein
MVKLYKKQIILYNIMNINETNLYNPLIIDEIQQILKRNKTYAETEKQKEESDRIKSEPLGDWQSPSDNARWQNLYRDLYSKKIKYNIGKLTEEQRNIEKTQLTDSISIVNNMIDNINKLPKPKKKFLQKIFCINVSVKPYNNYISILENIISDIHNQLPYYKLVLTP